MYDGAPSRTRGLHDRSGWYVRDVIPRGHEHYFQPVARSPLADGGVEILRACVCGLEERRTFRPEHDTPYEVTFRYAGLWLTPLDLLRLLPVGVEECPDCGGDRSLVDCATCVNLGIVENGEPLRMPELLVRR